MSSLGAKHGLQAIAVKSPGAPGAHSRALKGSLSQQAAQQALAHAQVGGCFSDAEPCAVGRQAFRLIVLHSLRRPGGRPIRRMRRGRRGRSLARLGKRGEHVAPAIHARPSEHACGADVISKPEKGLLAPSGQGLGGLLLGQERRGGERRPPQAPLEGREPGHGSAPPGRRGTRSPARVECHSPILRDAGARLPCPARRGLPTTPAVQRVFTG